MSTGPFTAVIAAAYTTASGPAPGLNVTSSVPSALSRATRTAEPPLMAVKLPATNNWPLV